MKYCQATSHPLDLLCWCAISLLFCVPQCKKSKPQTNERTKWLPKDTPPHFPKPQWSRMVRWELGELLFRPQEILWKSSVLGYIGCSLCWKLLWQLKSFKVENNRNMRQEQHGSSSLIFFSQGGKGSAWLWSYYLPSTWFCMRVHAVSCLETWLSFLVFLKYLPFEKICRWR